MSAYVRRSQIGVKAVRLFIHIYGKNYKQTKYKLTTTGIGHGVEVELGVRRVCRVVSAQTLFQAYQDKKDTHRGTGRGSENGDTAHISHPLHLHLPPLRPMAPKRP